MLPVPNGRIQQTLDQAKERASQSDWAGAIEIYHQILDGSRDADLLERARVTDLLAESYSPFAFQSKTRQEFKNKMAEAVRAQRDAQALYQQASRSGLSKRSRAREIRARFWVSDDFQERKALIKECIAQSEDASRTLDEEKDRGSAAESYRDLMSYIFDGAWIIGERDASKRMYEIVTRFGRRTLAEFEALGDVDGQVETLHSVLLFLPVWYDFVLDPSGISEAAVEIRALTKELQILSKRLTSPLHLAKANLALGMVTWNLEGDFPKALSLCEQSIEAARKVGDSRLLGRLLWGVVSYTNQLVLNEDDGDKRRVLLEKANAVAPESASSLEVSFEGSFLCASHSAHSNCLRRLAEFVETEVEKKKSHLEKAVEIGQRSLEYLDYWPLASPSLSRAYHELAATETDAAKKALHIKKALSIIEDGIRRVDLILHPASQQRFAARQARALLKADLAGVSENPQTQRELLQGAIADLEECIRAISRWAGTAARGSAYALHIFYEDYGNVLLQLYHETGEGSAAEKAIDAYEFVAKDRADVGLPGSAAHINWKIATIQDSRGKYGEAARGFREASEYYKVAGGKLPGSSSTFRELSIYMDAWSKVEQAKLNHEEEQYSSAAESYAKAATLMSSTVSWRYLANHYAACSEIERGETLSRQEDPKPSVLAFQEASRRFRETRAELETKQASADELERRDLANWLEITQGRESYCQARISLEEAKVLDAEGREEESGATYQSAAKTLQLLSLKAPTQRAKNELGSMALLSEAWAKMKQAETKSSPELYSEAAGLFSSVESIAERKTLRFSAMAHASICRALEAGTRFRRTRDTQLFAEIKKHLEAATDHYQQAGLQKASDWARATQRLFDALVYLADAETEREPGRRTQLYHLAEKHLQLAAKLYGQAGYHARRDEALRHLERTREEKEVLLSPVDALAKNPALVGAPVGPVSLDRDQAVGLEKFETCNVVGNLSLSQNEFDVGSDMILELEIANVGKTPATLIKLEDITTNGLEVDREKSQFRLADNYLDMRGKRLEYLKTHEVKIPLRGTRKGTYQLRPRVLFVDEKGSYRSYEFAPATVTVRELGISGWLKGPSK